jgi:hypothetical protein
MKLPQMSLGCEFNRRRLSHALNRVAGKHSPAEIAEASSFSLKTDSPQGISRRTIRSLVAAAQSLNPRNGTVDNASEFGPEFPRAIFKQTLLRVCGRKPGGIPIRFLGWFEPGYLAEMRGNGERSFRLQGIGYGARPPPEVPRKRNFFHPAMNARFLKGLKGRGLSECKTRLHATFGKNPAPAVSLYQQKFNATLSDAVTNGRHLLASFRMSQSLRELCGLTCTHGSRVRDASSSG